MRRILIFLLFVSALALPVVAHADSPTHLVAAGETLYSIARQYGVSPQVLASANGITIQDWVYVGQRLIIPGGSDTASASNDSAVSVAQVSPGGIYVVRAGDTLFSLARKFGISVSAIAERNNIPTNSFLATGAQLKLPAAAKPALDSPANPSNTQNNNSPANPLTVTGLIQVPNLPRYIQQQTLTCEEAVASMALRGALSEQQIVDAMPRSDNPFEGIRGDTNFSVRGGLVHYGTYAQGLQKGLAKLGRQSTTYYGQPYDKFKASILENLKQGRPVIWWTTWRESNQVPQMVTVSNGTLVPLTPYEHTVLIVSASDNGVTYNDPYDGSVGFTSWENHQRVSGYFNNMALVIY